MGENAVIVAPISDNALKISLHRMLGKPIIHAEWEATILRGGTLGDVRLVSGSAFSPNNDRTPFRQVWKRQQKWERTGDPGSWRREYDLYQSLLGEAFTPDFRRPACYHSEL